MKENLKRTMDFLTMEIVEKRGPIVEISFNRPISDEGDAAEVVKEADRFMRETVPPLAGKAYFVTCYDNLSISREVLKILQERFIGFNKTYSLGDTRYGGGLVARSFIISTAVKSHSESRIFNTREEALSALINQIE